MSPMRLGTGSRRLAKPADHRSPPPLSAKSARKPTVPDGGGRMRLPRFRREGGRVSRRNGFRKNRMEQEIEQVAARQTQPSGSGNGSASLDDAITLLSSCFALVRPTGMNDQAAEDWLSVASAELTGYPLSLVKIGCDAARRECTHHSQIVPFVLKKIGEMRPWS